MTPTEYWDQVMAEINNITEENATYSYTWEHRRIEAIERLYVRGIFCERGHA